MTTIYKIENQESWQTAKSTGIYEGSSDDLKDGFIHFSTQQQLQATLDKHYKGKSNLLLIALNSEILGLNLKWEPSRGGDLFPHLYAPLPTTHIMWEKPIIQNDNGTHSIPCLSNEQ